MPSQVEIKARVNDVDALLLNISKLADKSEPVELLQEDTFFNANNGRLKLRQFQNGSNAQLIFYNRPDTADAKLSEFHIVPVSHPEELKNALGLAVGIKGVVRKRRVLYLTGQTRIHVDHVDGLGDFMELEVLLREGQPADEGQRIAEDLMTKLQIDRSQLLSGAYMDMLLAGDSS